MSEASFAALFILLLRPLLLTCGIFLLLLLLHLVELLGLDVAVLDENFSRLLQIHNVSAAVMDFLVPEDSEVLPKKDRLFFVFDVEHNSVLF